MLYLLSKKAVKNENTEAKNNFPLTLEAKKVKGKFYMHRFLFPWKRLCEQIAAPCGKFFSLLLQ